MPMTDSEQAAGTPPPVAAYGTWPSPISAASVARARGRFGFPTIRGGNLWWLEGRADEGGRTALVHQAADGTRRVLLPAPWSLRTRVHEYGGQSFLPIPAGGPDGGWDVLFVHGPDQRMYRYRESDPDHPLPLTPEPPEPAALRYADFVLAPGGSEVWCVRERHEEGKVTRSIAAVPLDGSAAAGPDGVRDLVSGSDFFASPVPSPDGRHLAWVSWDHPRMPWDGCELWVAPLGGGASTGEARMLMGGPAEAVLAPLWRDAGNLYVLSDRANWWNLYQAGLDGTPPRPVLLADEEFGSPLWQLGSRPFELLSDGRLAVVHGRGDMRLAVLDPASGELTDVVTSYITCAPSLSADGTMIAAIAGAPDRFDALLRVDAATGAVEEFPADTSGLPDRAYLPVPRQAELAGVNGRTVHVVILPPANPDVTPPPGQAPPYIVFAHGGPTSRYGVRLELERAFFTSRGIGVIAVNYGGSCGFGRAYRERLRGQWGVVDVEDAMAAARALADAGEADPARLAIRGGSAGGWTALAAVTTGAAGGPVFAAAASYFGVTDLRTFAAQTHDFESRYLDGLIGPLPECDELYRERSPLGHVTRATCPILLLQGADDPVVPFRQSESFAAELAARGIPHAFLMFEGEAHGFRRTDTTIAALEAELSFYGRILGFDPPGITPVELITPAPQRSGAP